MMNHPEQDGGDFLPPYHRRIENSKSEPEFAIAMMTRFKRIECPFAQSWLLEYYMQTLVRKTAKRICSNLPKCIDPEDLIQTAYFGLQDCLTKYEPERNNKFETYTRRRIEGSMLDFLRREDPASRLARSRTKMIANGINQFHAEYGRRPTNDELKEQLQMNGQEFTNVMKDMHVPNTLSFHTASEDQDAEGLASISVELKHVDICYTERNDLRTWLCNELDTYDTLIVLLTYYEGLTMLEVGDTLGYSESRVSQRLKHIQALLKSKLGNKDASWALAS